MAIRKLVLSGPVVLIALAAGLCAASARADGDPAPTYQRERAALRFKGCHWTDEMGRYVYECIRKNDGMNAHWCYDERLEVYCPEQLEAAQKPDTETTRKTKPEN